MAQSGLCVEVIARAPIATAEFLDGPLQVIEDDEAMVIVENCDYRLAGVLGSVFLVGRHQGSASLIKPLYARRRWLLRGFLGRQEGRQLDDFVILLRGGLMVDDEGWVVLTCRWGLVREWWELADFDDELGVIVVAAKRLRHSSIDAIGDFADRGRLATNGILDELVRDALDFLGAAIDFLQRGKQRIAKWLIAQPSSGRISALTFGERHC
jgi:hypothetical protein